MPKVQAYTYRVRFIPTNEFYYGVRYAKNCSPDDLWKTYFTHSKKVKSLIEAHGKACWETEIRRTFKSKHDAIRWEERVNKYTTAWSNYLNENSAGAIHPAACARGANTAIKNKSGIHSHTTEERSNNGRKGGFATSEAGKGIHSLSSDEHKTNGKKGLDTQKENNVGFFGMTYEQHSEQGKRYGHIGGEKTKASGKGIFNKDDPLYHEWRRKGAVKGGQAMKGMKFWNNGVKNTRSKNSPGPEWVPGMIKKDKT